MGDRAERRMFLTWCALAAATVLSAWAGTGETAFESNAVAALTVIAVAVIKIRVVMREFMHVRHGPVILSWLTDMWLVLTCGTMVGMYLLGVAG